MAFHPQKCFACRCRDEKYASLTVRTLGRPPSLENSRLFLKFHGRTPALADHQSQSEQPASGEGGDAIPLPVRQPACQGRHPVDDVVSRCSDFVRSRTRAGRNSANSEHLVHFVVSVLMFSVMSHEIDDTEISIEPVQTRLDEFELPRRWQSFLITIAGLTAFIVLAASLRAAVSW